MGLITMTVLAGGHECASVVFKRSRLAARPVGRCRGESFLAHPQDAESTRSPLRTPISLPACPMWTIFSCHPVGNLETVNLPTPSSELAIGP